MDIYYNGTSGGSLTWERLFVCFGFYLFVICTHIFLGPDFLENIVKIGSAK